MGNQKGEEELLKLVEKKCLRTSALDWEKY